MENWRPRADSNRWIKVLQTFPLTTWVRGQFIKEYTPDGVIPSSQDQAREEGSQLLCGGAVGRCDDLLGSFLHSGCANDRGIFEKGKTLFCGGAFDSCDDRNIDFQGFKRA